MTRRRSIMVTMAAGLFLCASGLSAQTGATNLQPGDLLPGLSGERLSGGLVEIPSAAKDHPAIVLFTFSREGGRQAQEWKQHLSEEVHGLPMYHVMFLEAVPRPFRSVTVSGIKRGIPPDQQSHILLLYRDEDEWKQRLLLTNVDNVCLLLLGPDARIRWMTTGEFKAQSMQELQRSLQSVEPDNTRSSHGSPK